MSRSIHSFHQHLIQAMVLACGVAIILGPYYTEPNYNWVANSISELAGQHTHNAWIMRLGLLGLGLSAVAGYRWNLSGYNIVHVVFGLCIGATALFPHKPFFATADFSPRLDLWHSIFASAGGFCAVLAFVWNLIRSNSRNSKITALVLIIVFTAMSAAMGLWPSLEGLFQRIIFACYIMWAIAPACKR